jgi:hypothetical protein
MAEGVASSAVGCSSVALEKICMPPSLAEIARHEAGHAVVGSKLGLRLRSVTIEREGNTLGCCSWNDVPLHMLRDERAVMTAAGPCAACVVLGWRPTDAFSEAEDSPSVGRHWEDDRFVVMGLVMAGDDDDANRERFVYVIERAARQVERWRLQIDSVAAALIQERTLSGDSIRKLLGADAD